MSTILMWTAGIAIFSLLLGFAFFLIIESAAMILFYSAHRWETPRRWVRRVTGVDLRQQERGRLSAATVGGRIRIVLNLMIRAVFLIAGIVLLIRVGFLHQNLFWLLLRS